MELTQMNSGVKPIRWSFAQAHPVLTYLLDCLWLELALLAGRCPTSRAR